MRAVRQAASLLGVARAGARGPAVRAVVGARAASEWLQGRPPVVNPDAGTIAALYYKAVRTYDLPHRDILVAPQQDHKFTVEQFDRNVYAYAKGFVDGLNLKAGDKVALWLTNETENVVLQLACALIGVTAVNIDVTLGFPAVLNIVEREAARVLVLAHRYKNEMRAEALPTVFAPELEEFKYQTGYQPYASKRLRAFKFLVSTGKDPVPGVVRLRDLPVLGDAGVYGDVDDIAAIQTYVSPSDAVSVSYAPDASAPGGFARSAPLSHTDVLRAAASAAKALALSSADTVVVTAPLSLPAAFAAGAVAASQAHAKLVLPSKVFDAAKTLAALSQQRGSVLVATADQVAALAAAAAAAAPGTYDLAALRTGVVVDSPAPVKLGAASLLAGAAL